MKAPTATNPPPLVAPDSNAVKAGAGGSRVHNPAARAYVNPAEVKRFSLPPLLANPQKSFAVFSEGVRPTTEMKTFTRQGGSFGRALTDADAAARSRGWSPQKAPPRMTNLTGETGWAEMGFLERYPSLRDWDVVVVHANRNGAARSLDALAARVGDGKAPVLLLACEGGCSVAQALANKTDRVVVASEQMLHVPSVTAADNGKAVYPIKGIQEEDGETWLSTERVEKDAWKVYSPQTKK
jgi:hypothetical protein